MSKYKKSKVKGHFRDLPNGKRIWIKPYKRYIKVLDHKKIKQIQNGGSTVLSKKKRDLDLFLKEELIAIFIDHGFFSYNTEEKTKKELINTLADNLTDIQVSEWIAFRNRVKSLSNDEKYFMRILSQDKWRGFDEHKIIKLIGVGAYRSLKEKGIIDRAWGGDSYFLTFTGQTMLKCNTREFKKLITPDFKTMEKEIPENIIRSFNQLSHNKREYSIGLDFERELEQPQQLVALQGGKGFTTHFGDDFEMFGHTHPNSYHASPSKADLLNMNVGRPEFIIAGKGGDKKDLDDKLKYREDAIIFLNIEDENKYRKWKKNPDKDYKKLRTLFLDLEHQRDALFDQTGIRVYPYKRGMKLKLIDDPKLEKSFPSFSYDQLERISKEEKEREKKEEAKGN